MDERERLGSSRLEDKARARFVPSEGSPQKGDHDDVLPVGYDDIDPEDQELVRSLEPGSGEFWERVKEDLDRRRHPHHEIIRQALVGHRVPVWAAEYIAGRFAGTIKRSRGRVVWSSIGMDWEEAAALKPSRAQPRHSSLSQAYLAGTVFRLKRFYERYVQRHQRLTGRRPVGCDPYRAAVARVAKKHRISENTLDKYCYPRR